jgi:hypothetical protein
MEVLESVAQLTERDYMSPKELIAEAQEMIPSHRSGIERLHQTCVNSIADRGDEQRKRAAFITIAACVPCTDATWESLVTWSLHGLEVMSRHRTHSAACIATKHLWNADAWNGIWKTMTHKSLYAWTKEDLLDSIVSWHDLRSERGLPSARPGSMDAWIPWIMEYAAMQETNESDLIRSFCSSGRHPSPQDDADVAIIVSILDDVFSIPWAGDERLRMEYDHEALGTPSSLCTQSIMTWALSRPDLDPDRMLSILKICHEKTP